MGNINHSSAHLLQQEGVAFHHAMPTTGPKLAGQAMEPVERRRAHGRALHLHAQGTQSHELPCRDGEHETVLTWFDLSWPPPIGSCMYVPHVCKVVYLSVVYASIAWDTGWHDRARVLSRIL